MRCIFAGCVTVCFALGLWLLPLNTLGGQYCIDFEAYPDGTPTVEMDDINTQYPHLTFVMSNGIGPKIAKVGYPFKAFQSQNWYNDCDHASTYDDKPDPVDAATVGCSFLTDDGVLATNPATLHVYYDFLATEANGHLLDIDGIDVGMPEKWELTAYRGGQQVGPTKVYESGVTPDAGDGRATFWYMDKNDVPGGFDELRFEYTGNPNRTPGLGFDNFCTVLCDDLIDTLNTGWDNTTTSLIPGGTADDDWRLIQMPWDIAIIDDPAYIDGQYTPLSAGGMGTPPAAAWLGGPPEPDHNGYYWFEYKFCLNPGFTEPELSIVHGETNDSLSIYLNDMLIFGPTATYSPASFNFTENTFSLFRSGMNSIKVKLGRDTHGDDAAFALRGFVTAVNGTCCDSGACCYCDPTANCVETDYLGCYQLNGDFNPHLTCATVPYGCYEVYAKGDIDGDGIPLTTADLVYLDRWVHYLGPPPHPLYQADLNGDNKLDQLDVDVLMCYLQGGGLSCFHSYPVLTLNCPDTTRGACCWPCRILHPDNCADQYGIYQNNWTSCDPNPCGKCCPQITGNIDLDTNNIADISDLTMLIDYLFISLRPLTCPAAANTDGDSECMVDISDLSRLIDYLFISFREMEACMPECEL